MNTNLSRKNLRKNTKTLAACIIAIFAISMLSVIVTTSAATTSATVYGNLSSGTWIAQAHYNTGDMGPYDISHTLGATSASYDKELEDNQKIANKTEKFIASAESDLREYEKNAKAAGKKGHEIYEKRWKDKIKQSEKEISGLRKELKNLENNANKLTKQKAAALSSLTLEHDAEIKLMREPIVQLEIARDEKIFAYKQESNRLNACEKPIVEGIDRSTRLREDLMGGFDRLGNGDPLLKEPVLVYVSSYVVCYESGLARRYMFVSPSGLGYFDLSAKLKGTFGGSKISGLLVPRYLGVEALISKTQELTQTNGLFEGQLWSLGEKNNLLHNSGFRESARTGLPALRQLGWLTDREVIELGNQLTA